jgi:hypothetical protein
MDKQTKVMAGREINAAAVEEMARSVLRECGVPFTSVEIAAGPRERGRPTHRRTGCGVLHAPSVSTRTSTSSFRPGSRAVVL